MISKVSSIAYVAAISFVAVVSVQTAVAFVPTNGIISSSMTTHSTNRDQKKIMSTLNMSDNDVRLFLANIPKPSSFTIILYLTDFFILLLLYL